MDQDVLKKVVKLLDKRLKDDSIEFEVMSVLPREEKVSVKELLQNTDIRQQMEDSPAGLGLYFTKKKTKKPNQAYIKAGVMVIIVDNVRYTIPIDDIEEVKRWKKGKYQKLLAVMLAEGYFCFIWTPKARVKEVQEAYLRQFKNMKRKGDWYIL